MLCPDLQSAAAAAARAAAAAAPAAGCVKLQTLFLQRCSLLARTHAVRKSTSWIRLRFPRRNNAQMPKDANTSINNDGREGKSLQNTRLMPLMRFMSNSLRFKRLLACLLPTMVHIFFTFNTIFWEVITGRFTSEVAENTVKVFSTLYIFTYDVVHNLTVFTVPLSRIQPAQNMNQTPKNDKILSELTRDQFSDKKNKWSMVSIDRNIQKSKILCLAGKNLRARKYCELVIYPGWRGGICRL